LHSHALRRGPGVTGNGDKVIRIDFFEKKVAV
jgi:hypothetical protein